MIDKELVLEIKWVSPFKKSIKTEGYYRIVTFNVISGDYDGQPKTLIDDTNNNYKNWEPYLKNGIILTGLFGKIRMVV